MVQKVQIMKKLLVTMAALGAVASTSGFAQSKVAIYGLVDLGFVHERGGASGSVNKLTSGIANGSRIGFQGIEDLGDGLSAIFTIENGFQSDTGAAGQGGLVFGRQAFVGLTGGFGALKLGRQYTPLEVLIGKIDPFGNGSSGKMTNVFAAGYSPRINNAVIYTTPAIGGFSGEVAYGFGEVPGDISASRFVGASGGYIQGPLYVRLAYQNSNDITATSSAKNTVLGVTYDFGAVTTHFSYGTNETDAAGAAVLDNNDVMIGVSWPIGASKILASYVRKDDKLALNRDADQIGIGYYYAMSRRTTLYAAAARISNKRGASYTVGSAIESGSGNKAVNLGIRHTF